MTSSEPYIHDRPAVPFVGTTTGVTRATIAQIADRIPALIGALTSHGGTPAGAPFFRYLEIRGESMTVQVGVPVLPGTALPEPVVPFPTEVGELPAGRYATLTHVGPFDGLAGATQTLLDRARSDGLEVDGDVLDGVERWVARLEIYLTDPRMETDPNRYETELAIKLR